MQRIIVLSSRAGRKLQRWQLSDRYASLQFCSKFANVFHSNLVISLSSTYILYVAISRTYLSDKLDRYNGDSILTSISMNNTRSKKSGSFRSRARNKKKHGCQSPIWCPSSMHLPVNHRKCTSGTRFHAYPSNLSNCDPPDALRYPISG